MREEKYYVTHVAIIEPPEEGFNQLFYYTTKDKTLKRGKFYWGRGNNSFPFELINKLIGENKIVKINSEEYPLLIREDETLWFDKTGTVYKANTLLPFINQKKICILEELAKK